MNYNQEAIFSKAKALRTTADKLEFSVMFIGVISVKVESVLNCKSALEELLTDVMSIRAILDLPINSDQNNYLILLEDLISRSISKWGKTI